MQFTKVRIYTPEEQENMPSLELPDFSDDDDYDYDEEELEIIAALTELTEDDLKIARRDTIYDIDVPKDRIPKIGREVLCQA